MLLNRDRLSPCRIEKQSELVLGILRGHRLHRIESKIAILVIMACEKGASQMDSGGSGRHAPRGRTEKDTQCATVQENLPKPQTRTQPSYFVLLNRKFIEYYFTVYAAVQ